MSKKTNIENKTSKLAVWGVVVVFIAIVVGSFVYKSNQSQKGTGDLASFAQCITDKKAVLYGAFWCSHCKAQKELFGDSQKLLTYVECSTPDGKDQLQNCKDKQITGYPTWVFEDGSRASGELTLKTLSEKTLCVLSQ